jgi:putative phosphoserine phosphatase/1-acylglycerol-3-phosphate O-acyltransferase
MKRPAPPAGRFAHFPSVYGPALMAKQSPRSQRAAAFFDLDRTLLRGGSGPVISSALKEVGLLGDRNIPGEALLYRMFEVFGENRVAMTATRNAARFTSGWGRDLARQAGEIAADTLVGMVQPFARPIIDEHHAAGRTVVLATTTPFDVVWPLAERLGLDDVIATRYGEREDGTYDGSIIGDFVWGRGKLAAVRLWAEEAGVDLKDSFAYSDSWYDLPLLTAVGHPTAVNPDPRLLAAALARRWPVLHLDVPAGIPKLPVIGLEPQQLLMALGRLELVPFARFDIKGWENIPEAGPALIVGNHRSYFDALAMGLTLAKRGRPVRFLGKKELFDVPLAGPILRAMGGIRVDRGTGSEEPLRDAAVALAAGQLVALMPEGTIPRGPAFFDPVLKGRWGAARLAAMTGAPVIPVGMWGTEKVWPRSSRTPNVLNVLRPPTVRIRVGEPVAGLKGRSPDADTKRIMAAISALLPDEAREKRTPTADELARSYPPGKAPTGETHEATRRPGRD